MPRFCRPTAPRTVRRLGLVPSLAALLPLSLGHLAAADAEWAEAASQLPGVSEAADGNLALGDYPLLGMTDNGGVIIDLTGAGAVAIEAGHLRTFRKQLPTIIGSLTEAAAEAPSATPQQPYMLRPSALVGWYLQSTDQMVTEMGVLTRQAITAERTAEIEAVSNASQSAIAGLEQLEIDAPARRSVEHLFSLLPQQDTRPDGDTINPGFARRVVAHGFLDQELGQQLGNQAELLETAIAAATTLQPREVFSNDSVTLTHYTDAWGVGGFLLQSADRVAIARRTPVPFYGNPGGLEAASVVIDLPSGSDPIAEPSVVSEATSAQLIFDGQELASWSDDNGFSASNRDWRRVVPRGRGDQVRQHFPPHLVLADLSGGVHGIAVKDGLLPAPTGDGPESADAFLQRAAEVMPDAGHLDLIGQYLVKYVYDSPDPTAPMLIGNTEDKSDIHQTAEQILSTSAGGVCRGDCDDLSEIYQNITDRQGKLSYVISLPGHAAAAWAVQKKNKWHVFVLQTGPALEFIADSLPEALSQAYRRFDASDTFDPNAVGLLLRFSGENTRSSWRLSWRIFSDDTYATTMVDVQRDWHYQTYLQGIEKMRELLASGDDDNANYRELAGLYAFTGQYDKAVDYLQQAIERTEQQDSILYIQTELAMHMYEAGRTAEAQALVETLLTETIPAQREELGLAVMQVGLQLTGMIAEHDPVLAARVLNCEVTQIAQNVGNQLVNIIQQQVPREVWTLNGQVQMMRRIINQYSSLALTIAHEAGREAFTGDAGNPDVRQVLGVATAYMRAIAFHDADDNDAIMGQYGMLAQFLELSSDAGLAGLLNQIERVQPPETNNGVDHPALAQGNNRAEQLRWIKVSIPFWTQALMEVAGDHETKADPALVQQLATGLEQAIEHSARLGMDGPRAAFLSHVGQTLVAMLTEDADLLRERLAVVAERDDKRLRDFTAMWMGDAAPHTSAAFWDQVNEIWHSEVDYKPKYLWIAWRAALAGAHDHALATAALAAERFADDEAFVGEERYMRELFAGD